MAVDGLVEVILGIPDVPPTVLVSPPLAGVATVTGLLLTPPIFEPSFLEDDKPLLATGRVVPVTGLVVDGNPLFYFSSASTRSLTYSSIID